MLGTWTTIALGTVFGLALLVAGLAFGGWPVLVAFAIFVVVGGVLLAGASMRRSSEYVGHEDETKAPPTAQRSESHAEHGRPRSGGAPASGEGG